DADNPTVTFDRSRGPAPAKLFRRVLLQHSERRSRRTRGQQARPAPDEDLLWIDLRIEDQSDEAVAHLVPVLKPPANLLRRIRIEPVGRRVVEMRNADEARPFRQIDRLREHVPELPVEVPLRFEQRL